MWAMLPTHRLRFVMALLLAAGMTVLLLMLMVGLIAVSEQTIARVQRIKLPDVLMPDPTTELQRIIAKPVKPKIDKTPPPEIPQQQFDRIDGNAAVGQIGDPGKLDAQLDLGMGEGLQVTDGEYLPIVKVAPQYPRRALRYGIEGYVILQYTVTPQGTVLDPKVIESHPEGTFDAVAIASALRYKYRPRIMNGEAIAVSGVRTKITFQLQR